MVHFDLPDSPHEQLWDRAEAVRLADIWRRSVKLDRLQPDAPASTDLWARFLDYEEGDPEQVEDFLQPRAGG
jgi:hypothetical protein